MGSKEDVLQDLKGKGTKFEKLAKEAEEAKEILALITYCGKKPPNYKTVSISSHYPLIQNNGYQPAEDIALYILAKEGILK